LNVADVKCRAPPGGTLRVRQRMLPVRDRRLQQRRARLREWSGLFSRRHKSAVLAAPPRTQLSHRPTERAVFAQSLATTWPSTGGGRIPWVAWCGVRLQLSPTCRPDDPDSPKVTDSQPPFPAVFAKPPNSPAWPCKSVRRLVLGSFESAASHLTW